MKHNTAAALAVVAASAGLIYPAEVSADVATNPLPADQLVLGHPAQIGNSTWTVSNLKPSTDAMPYRPTGTLWEATAVDEATHGSGTPIVSNFNARARNGQTYRELFGVATAQGVNPAGLGQGQSVSGKLYFDVTGENPDSVVYNAGGPDLALWVQPPPSAVAGGSSAHASAAPAGSPAAAAPTPAPAAQPASRPGGSAGTAIPGTAQGTPAPGTVPGQQPPTASNPAAAGSPTPPAGQPTPANSPVSPAPVPDQAPQPGPATPGGPAVPAPASPVPSGSQGTPLQPATDQGPPAPVAPSPPTANTPLPANGTSPAAG